MQLEQLAIKKQLGVVNSVKATMHDWFGFDLTNEQAKDLINANYGACLNDILICGLDTCAREMLGDEISQRCTGRDWPCGCDGEDYTNKFFKDLAAGAKRLGYKPSAEAAWHFEA